VKRLDRRECFGNARWKRARFWARLQRAFLKRTDPEVHLWLPSMRAFSARKGKQGLKKLESETMELDLNKRYQTMIILWFALLMSVVMYFVMSQLAPPATAPPNSILTFTLTAIGTFLVVVSFVIKQKLLRRSVDEQDISLVQKALVIACAFCEAAAVLGLVERFAISGPPLSIGRGQLQNRES